MLTRHSDRSNRGGEHTVTFFIDAEHRHWSQARPWLEKACNEADGWWTIEALEQLLRDGKALLWVLAQDGEPIAAVVTTLCDWDGREVAEILVTGGTGILAGIADHFWKIEHWAKSHGAREIMLRGRRGWVKALKSRGYDEIAVTLRKAL